MYALGKDSPKWRTKCTTNGYISDWDNEWYYHFSVGGFKDIEWVELQSSTKEQEHKILSLLKQIHVPGIKTENGYMVFGYVNEGQVIDYL